MRVSGRLALLDLWASRFFNLAMVRKSSTQAGMIVRFFPCEAILLVGRIYRAGVTPTCAGRLALGFRQRRAVTSEPHAYFCVFRAARCPERDWPARPLSPL